MTRGWSVHSFTDQGARLFVGGTLENPWDFFHIDYHPDHAQTESGSRFAHLAHGAFSSAISNNLRMLGKIRQFGIISEQGQSEEATWL